MGNCINVALAADSNYFQPLSVVMVSILKNADKNDKFHFYILCNGVSEDLKSKILGLKNIREFDIDFFDIDNSEFESFNSLPDSHITLTAYSRMKLSNLLPNVKKIIYLDCDVIVKSSLNQLFNIDISDYYIAAVEDIGCTFLRKYNKDICPYDFLYINSGVLLINLQKWREDDIAQKLYDTAKSKVNHFQHDQEIINIVCHDKCLPLDVSWNVQDSFFRNDAIVKTNDCVKEIRKAARHPKIIHYTFKLKPWNNISMPKSFDWWYYNKYSTLPLKMSIRQKFDLYKSIVKRFFSKKYI